MLWHQLRIDIIFFLATFALLGRASAQACLSPFKHVSSGHHALADFDLFQVYNSELKELKIAFSEKSRVSAKLQEKNILGLHAFYKYTPFATNLALPNRPVQSTEALEILNSVAAHPVIGSNVAQRYDPTQEIGFCFGRAAYVHIELLRRGVAAQNIAKVFVMGGLFVDNIGWDFHVATIAQDESGTWWAIDSLFKAPLPLEDWMYEVAKWDANQKFPGLRFYFTQPTKFQALKGSYDSGSFYSDVYHKYFEDLTAWYTHPNNCLTAESSADPNFFICQKL